MPVAEHVVPIQTFVDHQALQKGGAISVMASYNEVDGVPSHASKWLLRDVLRIIESGTPLTDSQSRDVLIRWVPGYRPAEVTPTTPGASDDDTPASLSAHSMLRAG